MFFPFDLSTYPLHKRRDADILRPLAGENPVHLRRAAGLSFPHSVEFRDRLEDVKKDFGRIVGGVIGFVLQMFCSKIFP